MNVYWLANSGWLCFTIVRLIPIISYELSIYIKSLWILRRFTLLFSHQKHMACCSPKFSCLFCLLACFLAQSRFLFAQSGSLVKRMVRESTRRSATQTTTNDGANVVIFLLNHYGDDDGWLQLYN